MKTSNINKSGMFSIWEFNIYHTCPLKDTVYSQKHAISMLIGGNIKLRLLITRRNIHLIFRVMWKIYLKIDFNCSLSWRAKKKTLIFLRDTTSVSYKKLTAYLYTINITYLGSHITQKKIDKKEFLYLFVALNSFIQDFNHFSPVIVVDESRLRGSYSGTFVAASTMCWTCMLQCVFECIFFYFMLLCI